MSKQVDTNVKLFMQTETYSQLRDALQNQINVNSQAFNLKIPQPSNLVEPTDHTKVKMTRVERDALKKAKYTFKANPDKGRDEMVKELINAPAPNWNVVVRERRKNI